MFVKGEIKRKQKKGYQTSMLQHQEQLWHLEPIYYDLYFLHSQQHVEDHG